MGRAELGCLYLSHSPYVGDDSHFNKTCFLDEHLVHFCVATSEEWRLVGSKGGDVGLSEYNFCSSI